MVTGVVVDTGCVFTGMLVLVEPAGTPAVAGTVAAAALLESETETPPVGAGPLKASVAVEEAPAVTLVGLSVREERVTEPDICPVLSELPLPQEYEHRETAQSKVA